MIRTALRRWALTLPLLLVAGCAVPPSPPPGAAEQVAIQLPERWERMRTDPRGDGPLPAARFAPREQLRMALTPQRDTVDLVRVRRARSEPAGMAALAVDGAARSVLRGCAEQPYSGPVAAREATAGTQVVERVVGCGRYEDGWARLGLIRAIERPDAIHVVVRLWQRRLDASPLGAEIYRALLGDLRRDAVIFRFPLRVCPATGDGGPACADQATPTHRWHAL